MLAYGATRCGAEFLVDAIGVVAAGVEPENDGRAGVKELAADDDLIADALDRLARPRGFALAANQKRHRQQSNAAQIVLHVPPIIVLSNSRHNHCPLSLSNSTPASCASSVSMSADATARLAC